MRNSLILLISAAASLFGDAAGRGITAKVPFGFEANGIRMAAGEYTVSHMASRGLVVIRGRMGTPDLLFRAAPGKDNRERANGLVFHRYGDRYFLDAVAMENSRALVQIPKAKSEREMAKGMEPSEMIVTAP